MGKFHRFAILSCIVGAVLVFTYCSLLQKQEPETQEVPQAKASEIVVGSSTWKDVEGRFGKAYLIEEPASKEQRVKVWLMFYPMLREYGVDVRFTINRKTGVVEKRSFGLGEPDIVRTLVTEFHAPYCSSEEPWGKPEYRGIIVGESTGADVQRVLGMGTVTECPSPLKEFALLQYSAVPDFQARVTFGLKCDTKVVEYILLEPTEPWPLQKVLSMYGSGYCYRRFYVTAGPQVEDMESGRLVENPRGNWVHVEYRSKGLVLSPNGHDRIRLITYKKERQ